METSELQYGETRWEASDTARNNRRERSQSVGGLHCETSNPRGPRSHVGTDQENIHLPGLRLNEKIVHFHCQAALGVH